MMSDPAYNVFCQNSTAVLALENDVLNDEGERAVDDDLGVGLLFFLGMSQIRST
jgi:hypothetical protein